MTFLAQRLKKLRASLSLSLDEIGSHGFVTATGWSKLENGVRVPSDHLIEQFCSWLFLSVVYEVPLKRARSLRKELLLLKYLAHKSPFVRDMAGSMARTTAWGCELLASVYGPMPAKAKRARRAKAGKGGRK